MEMFDKLKGLVPQTLIDDMMAHDIDTPLRAAHFLAQAAHESGGFKFKSENLNYGKEGLLKIFPKYFTPASAEAYNRNSEKIASKVYANRMGNGDEASKDGWRFKGRGYIQLTGKDNYTAFGKSINEDICANPQTIADKYALLSAAWFFNKNGLHKMADGGATDAVVTSITKRVNGGTIGLADRIKHFKEYHALLA